MLSASAGTATAAETEANDDIEALSLHSTASQVSAEYAPLTDEAHVVAWASADAYVTSTDDGTDEAPGKSGRAPGHRGSGPGKIAGTRRAPWERSR